MAENITYNYLWQALQKEKQTNQLLLIPKTFYNDAIEHINMAKSEANPDLPTIENTSRLLYELFEKRKQKILIYAAYGKQLPKPIADSEQEFYDRIVKASKSETLPLSSETRQHVHTLKSIKDIPEIILPSGSRIGPLKRDQIIDIINEQDKNYLVENTICETA